MSKRKKKKINKKIYQKHTNMKIFWKSKVSIIFLSMIYKNYSTGGIKIEKKEFNKKLINIYNY